MHTNKRLRPPVALLLLAGLIMLSPIVHTSVPLARADEPTPTPSVEEPPTYYRPSGSAWLSRLESSNTPGEVELVGKYSNDPINLIIYQPPDSGPVKPDALVNGALLDSRNVFPNLLNPSLNTRWYDVFGEWSLWNTGYLERTCYNDLSITPIDGKGPAELKQFFATTSCPGLGAPYGIRVDEPGPSLIRNHFRLFVHPDFPRVAYTTAAFEENFAVPLRCDLAAHCGIDWNRSRDEIAEGILRGARLKGWDSASWDLANQYTATNTQDGPYDGVKDFRNDVAFGISPPPAEFDGSDDFVEPASYAEWARSFFDQAASPLFIPDRTRTIFGDTVPYTVDGTVRVICLDPQNNGGCNKRPAERPLVFNNLTPRNGAEFDGFGTQIFRVETGYSDERRAVKPPVYTIAYPATNGSTKTVNATAELQGGDNGGKSQWQVAIALPNDIRFDQATGTAKASVSIKACDNGDQIYQEANGEACWTYKDLTYVLRERAEVVAEVLIMAPIVATTTDISWQTQADTAATVLNLDSTRYHATNRRGVDQLRQADLTNVRVLVLMGLPLQASDAETRTKVKDFLNNGGSVLIVGEHGRFSGSSQLAGLYALSSQFGLDFGTRNLAPACRADQPALVVNGAVLGVPNAMETSIAGANTVSGGTAVLEYGGQTIAAVNELSAVYNSEPGRVAAVGDSNIWGGCGATIYNARFIGGLFNWLTRRVSS